MELTDTTVRDTKQNNLKICNLISESRLHLEIPSAGKKDLRWIYFQNDGTYFTLKI